MKRRVGIAQALLGNPSIILLDEPTVGLDSEERERFVELIKKITNDDKTVLLSTHILNDVDDCCNKVIILKKEKSSLMAILANLNKRIPMIT